MKHRITRRGLLTGMGAMAGAAVLGACAATPAPAAVEDVSPTAVATAAEAASVTPSGEVVELSFQHFFQQPYLWEPAFVPIFTYIEEKVGVKINHIPTPYAEMGTKLLALIGGGTPPDLTSLDNLVLPGVAKAGVLLPLDDRMEVDPPCPIEDIMPSRLIDNSWDGKLYGLPIDEGSDGLYYNKAIFDSAGMSYPNPDWTWDQLLEAASALTVDGNGKSASEAGFDPDGIKQWGFQFNTSLHRMHNLVTSLSGNEVWFDKEVTRCTMDSPEIVEALQYLVDLRCAHHVSPTAEQATGMSGASGGLYPFGLGYYAMEFAWCGLVSNLKLEGVTIGDQWDVTTYPKGKKAVATSGGQGFPIIKDSKHPDEAWAVLKEFMSETVMKMLGQNGAWMPARISMAPYGQPIDGVPEHYVEGLIDPVATYGFSKWWYVPGYPEWDATIISELDPCWLCQRSAQEAVEAFLPAVNEMVAGREK